VKAAFQEKDMTTDATKITSAQVTAIFAHSMIAGKWIKLLSILHHLVLGSLAGPSLATLGLLERPACAERD